MEKYIRGFVVAILFASLVSVPTISFAQYVEEDVPTIPSILNDVLFGEDGLRDDTLEDPWENIDPTVQTVAVKNITRTSASVQVYFNSNGAYYKSSNAPVLYLEYGTDRDMEQHTEAVSQERGGRTVTFGLKNLERDEKYYVRAVLLYGNRVAYGDRLSFLTEFQTSSSTGGTTGGSSGTLNQGGGGSTTVTPPATTPKPTPKPAPKPAVDKDKDTSFLGPSIFGEGFFPQTLLGWVIILGLIIVIVFLVLGALKKKKD